LLKRYYPFELFNRLSRFELIERIVRLERFFLERFKLLKREVIIGKLFQVLGEGGEKTMNGKPGKRFKGELSG